MGFSLIKPRIHPSALLATRWGGRGEKGWKVTSDLENIKLLWKTVKVQTSSYISMQWRPNRFRFGIGGIFRRDRLVSFLRWATSPTTVEPLTVGVEASWLSKRRSGSPEFAGQPASHPDRPHFALEHLLYIVFCHWAGICGKKYSKDMLRIVVESSSVIGREITACSIKDTDYILGIKSTF